MAAIQRRAACGNASVKYACEGKAMEAMDPLADPLRFERRVPESTIVIFGANGDLAKRKLLPSLYRLDYDKRLPASFAILGTSRTEQTDDQFRERMHDAV